MGGIGGRMAWVGLLAALWLLACSSGQEARPAPAGAEPAAAAPTPDVASGRQIYANVCATCHGASPSEDGTLGPAIAGASAELVRAKVVRGEYPPGYTPKRGSRSMPPLPYLEAHVDDIAAFLQAAGS